jgi:hypothetical protein
MPTQQEWIDKLNSTEEVTFVTRVAAGTSVLLHTRDKGLVEKLGPKAHVVWFDRTEYSTRYQGGTADMQAEVVLGPAFFNTEE